MAQPASLLFFAAAILSAVLAAAAGLAPQRANASVRFMFLANLSILVWTASYFVQITWSHMAEPALAPLGSADYLLMLAIISSVCLAATYFFLFSASLSPRASWWLTHRGLWVAHLPFIYTFVAAALNPLDHLFIRASVRGADAGPLAIPHYVSVLGLVAAGIYLMLWPGISNMTRRERSQRLMIGLAACAPLAGSLVWLLRRFAGIAVPVNPTPALFALVGCVLGFEVLYRGFGNLVPLAALSSIVENTEAHLAYLWPDLRFVAVNEAFRRRSLRLESELIGRSYFDVMPDGGRSWLFEAARQTGRPVERSEDTGVFPQAAGQPDQHWKWTITPVFERGELQAFVLSYSDVTEQTQERDLARTLAELDTRIQRGFASETAMWDVVRQAGVALDSDALLVTPGDHGLRVRDSRTPQGTEPYDADAYPHVAQVLTGGRSVVVEDAMTDERFGPGVLASFAIRSALVVPLRTDSEVLGAMSFQRSMTRDGFTTVQVDFAERFAGAVAAMMRNSRRYEDERRIAQTLQESMLRISFDVPGVDFSHTYRSATEAARVGGDFYDLFQTDDGRVALLIGDVAGHGLEAAVLTSLIKNTVRSAAIEHTSPARVMHAANEVMWRQTDPEMFATAFFGLLDPEDGVLTYCSAGHPPSIVLGQRGEVAELPLHSLVLGLGPEAVFSEASTRLESGQLLLLYTDGLTEARCGGEFFGTKRLCEVLADLGGHPAEDVVRSLFDSVVAYCGGRFCDDIAVLAVRLLPPARAAELDEGDQACTG